MSGVADNDPSCIGTYAVTGASLGVSTLWLAPLLWPMGAAIQIICSRIGMVGGRGLAEVVRRHYSPYVLYPVVTAVAAANTITLGADISAIVDAAGLVAGRPVTWAALPLAAALVALQVFWRYATLARVLKLLTLTLFAYVVALFSIDVRWSDVARALVPHWSSQAGYAEGVVALIGAALSPYIFFWQSSQEVEQEKAEGRVTASARRGAADDELHHATVDVSVGMAVPSVLMFSVTLATAATLFASGRGTGLQSAADAAAALTPLAGRFAGAVFAAGLIGTGLLAVPVLSASAAYAVAGALRWTRGLDEHWRDAPGFYAVIAASTLAGSSMIFLGASPMRLLFFSSLLNGLVTPPLMLLILLAGRNDRVMGHQPIGAGLTALGAATAVLTWGAALLLVASRL